MRRLPAMVALAAALLLPAAAPGAPAPRGQYGKEVFDKVGFDQHLNAALPLDARFTDANGDSGPLRRFFGTRPVLLVLAYYDCPNLCSAVLEGTTRAAKRLGFTTGRDYDVVVVSIDPGEGPAIAGRKKARYLAEYGRPGGAEGWHFLTGTKASIDRLARAAGFRYAYDSKLDQYAHPAGIMVVTPQGRIARYMFGVKFNPRDLRLGLVEAADGKIGSPVDSLLLLCYQYDPQKGSYGLLIMNVLRAGGAATALLIGGSILLMMRREKRRRT